MMKYMIDLGLFSLNNEKLVCYSLAKRLDQSMTSSPKMRNIISNIKENHDPVMIKSCKNRIDKIRKEENKEDKSIDKKEILFSQLIKQYEHYDIYEIIALDFIAYRKQIKKPLKTILPIKQFIDSLIELSKLGYSFDYCMEQMKSNEWQTVKKDYIHKPKPQQSFKKSNTDGNAEFIRQHYGINEDGNIIDTEFFE